MARQEGLLIGISAGSLVKTAIDIAQEEAAADAVSLSPFAAMVATVIFLNTFGKLNDASLR